MDRQLALADLIAHEQWSTGAMLGVNQGQTFFHLLNQFPDLRLIGVDQWSGTRLMQEYGVRVRRVAQNLFPGRASILHCSIEQAADQVSTILDFVVLDSKRAYSDVGVREWESKIREYGAMITCNDDLVLVSRV